MKDSLKKFLTAREIIFFQSSLCILIYVTIAYVLLNCLMYLQQIFAENLIWDIFIMILWFSITLFIHKFIMEYLVSRFKWKWNSILFVLNWFVGVITIVTLYLGFSSDSYPNTPYAAVESLEMFSFLFAMYWLSLPICLSHAITKKDKKDLEILSEHVFELTTELKDMEESPLTILRNCKTQLNFKKISKVLLDRKNDPFKLLSQLTEEEFAYLKQTVNRNCEEKKSFFAPTVAVSALSIALIVNLITLTSSEESVAIKYTMLTIPSVLILGVLFKFNRNFQKSNKVLDVIERYEISLKYK